MIAGRHRTFALGLHLGQATLIVPDNLTPADVEQIAKWLMRLSRTFAGERPDERNERRPADDPHG